MLHQADLEWVQDRDKLSLSLNLSSITQPWCIQLESPSELLCQKLELSRRSPTTSRSLLKNGYRSLPSRVSSTSIWKGRRPISGTFQDSSMEIQEKQSHICKTIIHLLYIVLITGIRSMIIRERSIGKTCTLNIYNMLSLTLRHIWYKLLYRATLRF